jgi:hypothetical protein
MLAIFMLTKHLRVGLCLGATWFKSKLDASSAALFGYFCGFL